MIQIHHKNQGDVYARYVDGSGGMIGNDFYVSTNAADQARVMAKVDWVRTKKVLVSWIDKRNGTDYDIYRAQVDLSGNVTGEGVIAGAPTATASEQRAETVVYATDGVNDLGFIVIWMDQRNGTDNDVYGYRLWP